MHPHMLQQATISFAKTNFIYLRESTLDLRGSDM